METKTGPICGVENCRSRRYRLGPDGYDYCQNGHKRDTGPIVGDDDYREGASQRYAKTSRVQREKEEKVETYLGGREAMVMYLQCFQLILWKQANWLVKVKGYPQELETIIHDLWALRLQMLRALVEDPDERRAVQMFSTQSETEDSDAERAGSAVRQANLRQRAPKLIETVSLCYLGLMLLRLPVCSSNVHEWVMSEGFVYLRALQELPQVMKQQLSLPLRGKFHARTGPGELERLHITTVNLSWAFQGSFGMEFPALNHHLLLYRFISELALPLDVFVPVTNLARLLGYNFKFPPRPSRRALLRLHQYPEIQLLCTLIIITKLYYPFDSDVTLRNPTSPNSPAALVIDWTAWNDARTRYNDAVRAKDPASDVADHGAARRNAALLGTTEDDVFCMSGADADAYLTWFERTWNGYGDPEGDGDDDDNNDEREAALAASYSQSAAETEFRRALFRFFPSGGAGAADGDRNGQASEKAGPGAEDDAEDVDSVGEVEDAGVRDAAAQARIDAEDVDSVGEVEDTAVRDTVAQARIERIAAVQKTLLERRAIAERDAATRSSSGSDSDSVMEQTSNTVEKNAAFAADVLRPGSRYRRYKSFEVVPLVGKPFFEDAAKLVGLRVEELTTAVSQVEMKVQRWVERKRSGESEVDADGDANMGE